MDSANPATFISQRPAIGQSRDLAIEGLRGLAAVMVFYHHLLTEPTAGWTPAGWWSWAVSGPAAVLVFFVLSGYVIGLSCAEGSATGKGVARYAGRRALRLFPINVAAVLITCAVAEAVDWPTVLGNLFFLQNFSDYAGAWMLVLRENYNLWSLNYEVLFYLVFAALWWKRVPLAWTVATTLAIGALGWFGGGVPVFVACYAFGFLFWLAGLALAWRGVPREDERSNWPSAVLIALVTWKLQGLNALMLEVWSYPPRFAGPVVKLYDLEFLPVCVWLLAAVGKREFRGLGLVQAVAVLVPLLGFTLRAAKSPDWLASDLPLLAAIYVGALVLWKWRASARPFERWAWLGLISYGLYATARPIQIGIFRVGQALPAGPWSYLLCAALVVIVALGVAWYLERRLQPGIARIFRRREATAEIYQRDPRSPGHCTG